MKVKWQSKLFPKLILTQDHYEEMRKLFPDIDSFKTEMEELERWLYANESKRPRSHWKSQVSNWMRKANRIAREKHQQRLVRGKERPMSHQEASKSLSEILKGVGAAKG